MHRPIVSQKKMRPMNDVNEEENKPSSTATKANEKTDPPSSSSTAAGGRAATTKVSPVTYRPVATMTRQSLAYLSVSGIQNETSYIQRDWPVFALKELSDNAFDF